MPLPFPLVGHFPRRQPLELKLGKIGDIAELEAMSLDRLKAALMFLGVKCGGTLEQRAERLWSLKGVKREDIDPKLLAKPSKKRKHDGEGEGGGAKK